MLGEIAYPLPSFNGAAVVGFCISNFILHFIMDVITYIHAGTRVDPSK